MGSEDLPHATPLQSHTVHVVVGDLNDLLKTEHARLSGAGQLLVRHSTQTLHKINWKIKWLQHNLSREHNFNIHVKQFWYLIQSNWLTNGSWIKTNWACKYPIHCDYHALRTSLSNLLLNGGHFFRICRNTILKQVSTIISMLPKSLPVPDNTVSMVELFCCCWWWMLLTRLWVWLLICWSPWVMYLVLTPVPTSCASSRRDMHCKTCGHATIQITKWIKLSYYICTCCKTLKWTGELLHVHVS